MAKLSEIFLNIIKCQCLLEITMIFCYIWKQFIYILKWPLKYYVIFDNKFITLQQCFLEIQDNLICSCTIIKSISWSLHCMYVFNLWVEFETCYRSILLDIVGVGNFHKPWSALPVQSFSAVMSVESTCKGTHSPKAVGVRIFIRFIPLNSTREYVQYYECSTECSPLGCKV